MIYSPNFSILQIFQVITESHFYNLISNFVLYYRILEVWSLIVRLIQVQLTFSQKYIQESDSKQNQSALNFLFFNLSPRPR